MRRKLIAVLAAAAMLLCGCAQTNSQTSGVETLPELTEPPTPALMYYVTDHGTTAVDAVTRFQSAITEKGYVFQADALAALPSGADLVILNTPREDLTGDEQAQLERYMADGGHLLLLMPADKSETRYKYLERFLEHYCIRMDYDRILETDKSWMQAEDPAFPQISQISAPTGMTILPATADRPLYMHNARSFHFIVLDNYSDIRQDAMLESGLSSVGEPCGGTADDPVTFENEMLMAMCYSRDATLNHAFVVCVGASDFLLDENYEETSSLSAQDYVYAAIDWAADPSFQ